RRPARHPRPAQRGTAFRQHRTAPRDRRGLPGRHLRRPHPSRRPPRRAATPRHGPHWHEGTHPKMIEKLQGHYGFTRMPFARVAARLGGFETTLKGPATQRAARTARPTIYDPCLGTAYNADGLQRVLLAVEPRENAGPGTSLAVLEMRGRSKTSA